MCLDLAFCAFHVLCFFFFFFHAFQLQGQLALLSTVHGTHIHFIQEKNIKNKSHDTIHIFKNYFVTVFSVFSKISCIQMDPKCPFRQFIFCQFILLLSFFLLLFMGSIALFDTIHGSTILFQLTFTFIYNNFSKFFSFSKISRSQTDLNNLVIPFQLTFIFIYNTFNKNFSFSKKFVYSRFGYSICTFAFSVCAFCLLFFFLVSRVF